MKRSECVWWITLQLCMIPHHYYPSQSQWALLMDIEIRSTRKYSCCVIPCCCLWLAKTPSRKNKSQAAVYREDPGLKTYKCDCELQRLASVPKPTEVKGNLFCHTSKEPNPIVLQQVFGGRKTYELRVVEDDSLELQFSLPWLIVLPQKLWICTWKPVSNSICSCGIMSLSLPHCLICLPKPSLQHHTISWRKTVYWDMTITAVQFCSRAVDETYSSHTRIQLGKATQVGFQWNFSALLAATWLNLNIIAYIQLLWQVLRRKKKSEWFS